MSDPTSPRSTALSMAELERINAVSRHQSDKVNRKVEALAIILVDAHMDQRLVVHMCKGCFYGSSHFAGQAFTEWHCLLCKASAMHPNTAVPRLCSGCADTFGLCVSCGGDIEMKHRSRFDRRAKKKAKRHPRLKKTEEELAPTDEKKEPADEDPN